MPRRTRKRMRGGFMESLTNAWQGLTQSTSDLYEKSKQSVSNTYNSMTQSTPTTSSSSSSSSSSSYIPSMSTTSYGGRKRRKMRKMRGGNVSDNISLNNLASRAAPIDGIKTAQPQVWVGGKRTKRRTRKHRKSRRY